MNVGSILSTLNTASVGKKKKFCVIIKKQKTYTWISLTHCEPDSLAPFISPTYFVAIH
jgi:hypothetical protein